nr:division/cell wall cluster transcriptional repressor MraZ [Sandaracinobacteroides sayramensis]
MAEQLKYDDTGRIILTPTLRDAGELASQAVFLGAGDYFELWSPDVLLAEPDLDPRMSRAVKSLLAGRAA